MIPSSTILTSSNWTTKSLRTGRIRCSCAGTSRTITNRNRLNFPVCRQITSSPTTAKGIAAGYTALLSNTLINNFRYAFIRQGVGDSGLNTQPFNRLRGLNDVVGLTPTILTNVPVHNFIDDVSWTKGRHTIQFGTNWRLIHNNRQSNAQNLSEGYENLYWMNPSFIAGEGTSLDPSNTIGSPLTYPGVDGSFGTSYSFAAMQLMGIMSQIYTTTNQDKNANLIPSGDLVQRHFRNFEGEMYLQDKWNVTPNLTVTAGLRIRFCSRPTRPTETRSRRRSTCTSGSRIAGKACIRAQ